MQTDEYADLPPPDVNALVRGGLAGTGHIVCRAIISEIVAFCAERRAWSPFSFKKIAACCPETGLVVSRFLSELIVSGRLHYDGVQHVYVITPKFVQDCVQAAHADTIIESGW